MNSSIINKIKIFLRNMLQETDMYRYSFKTRRKRVYLNWVMNSKQGMMPAYAKELLLRSMAQKSKAKIFVETGTFLGETVYAFRKDFEKLISIELSNELASYARKRFARYPNITIIQGDSSARMADVLRGIDDKAMFWLDGHYSGSITAKGESVTPILAELDLIFKHKITEHIILIDDARCFNGTDGYPQYDTVVALVRNRGKYNSIETVDDVIVIMNK